MDGQSHGNGDGRADDNGDADDNGVGIDVSSSGTGGGSGTVDHGMSLDVFYGFTEHVIKQLEKVRTTSSLINQLVSCTISFVNHY